MRTRRPFGGSPPPPPDEPPDDLAPAPGSDPDEAETRIVRPRRTSGELRDVRETEVVSAPRRPLAPPERNPWPWLLALLVLVLGGLAAAYFLTRGGGDKKTVPSVAGTQQADALGRLGAAGFKPHVRLEFSSKAKGIVTRTQPRGGVRAKKGSVVLVFVSKGSASVNVPNLRGLTEGQAASKLTAAGLQANVFRVPSTQPEGQVIAQQPAPDQRVQKGAQVRINVSRGVTQTSTTTVVTPTTATVTTPTSTTPTTTTPTNTTPTTGGTSTATGATTTGTTAARPVRKEVSVPDVGSLAQQEAAAQLAKAGLLADSYPVASSQPGGTIVAQTPTAGQTLTSGSVVRLNVSIGTGARPQGAIPDVTGGDERGARSRLRGVGFTVRAIYRTATAKDQVGKVILQKPDAGASARVRFQITIYVGRLAGSTTTGTTTTP